MVIQVTGRIAPDLCVLGTVRNPIYLTGSGNEWALIEGGLEWMAPLVLRQVDEHLADRSYLRHWFITHSHYDHCGLLGALYPLFPGIQVHATAAVARAFGSARARAVVRDLNLQVRALPGFDQQTGVASEPGGGDTVAQLEYVALDIVVGGDVIHIGAGNRLRAIETPGHSRCSTSYFDEGTGRVFVSDALGELVGEHLWYPLAFDDLARYQSSIQQIGETGATSILLAHHALLTGEHAAVAASQAACALDAFASEVDALLRANGGDVQAAAREISLRFREASAPFVPPALHEASARRIVDLLGDGLSVLVRAHANLIR